MIWDDPWCYVAANEPGGTALAPIQYTLASNQKFITLDLKEQRSLQHWICFVKTTLSEEEALRRIKDGHVLILLVDSELVATCIIRHIKEDLWMLETLRAKHGYATPLLRQTMMHLYRLQRGRFSLAYTWELTGWGMVIAGLKGWLNTAISIHRGWNGVSDPEIAGRIVESSSDPEVGEIIEFTGGDSCPLALAHDPSPHSRVSTSLPLSVNVTGGSESKNKKFKSLWCHSLVAPGSKNKWKPSGWVVLGCLNRRKSLLVEWPTNAEI